MPPSEIRRIPSGGTPAPVYGVARRRGRMPETVAEIAVTGRAVVLGREASHFIYAAHVINRDQLFFGSDDATACSFGPR